MKTIYRQRSRRKAMGAGFFDATMRASRCSRRKAMGTAPLLPGINSINHSPRRAHRGLRHSKE